MKVNHAEGTEAIAAALDRHVACHTTGHAARDGARGVQSFIRFEGIEPGVLHELTRSRALDVIEQAPIAVRTDHEIHVGRLFAQFTAQVLGHAAGDAKNDAFVAGLVLGQHAGAPAHAFNRALAHGAGVDEDHVGARWIQRARVAALLEEAQYHLGVGHIHLAAGGFDVNRGRRHRAFYSTGAVGCPRLVPTWLLLGGVVRQAGDLVGRLGPRGSVRWGELQVFLEPSQGGRLRPGQKFGLSQLEVQLGLPGCFLGNPGLRLAEMLDCAGGFSADPFPFDRGGSGARAPRDPRAAPPASSPPPSLTVPSCRSTVPAK